MSDDDPIVVQCRLDTASDSILIEALARLGVRAEIKCTAGNNLEGTLAFTGSGTISAGLLGKLGLSVTTSGKAAKSRQTESEPIGTTPANLSWVARILAASEKRLIVEDFHYVSEESRKSFAFILKALGEYGVCPIIVGIWPQDNLLPYYNGDLDGRVEDIHLIWSNEELQQVLLRGAEAFNISISPSLRNALVSDAYSNVGLLQRLTEQLCIQEGLLKQPTDDPPYLTVGVPLDRARAKVAAQMRPRYEAFADNFVRGMRRLTEGLEVYRHLLQILTESSDEQLLQGIDAADLRGRIILPRGRKLRQSDLTRALERVDRLQAKIDIRPIVLTYHRPSRRVFVVDRSFLFFRKYGSPIWPWSEDEFVATNDLAKDDPLDLA